MRIDIADTPAEQRLALHKLEHFRGGGDLGSWQVIEGGEDVVTLFQTTQGQFADHERMHKHHAATE